ncbi:MAG TPA: CPBP family intramembrane glutamic endopeptidase [Candidatus Acidoferrales bacterium]|nr:CPBP family intramembrane glutamic endopeptidase [Candidatus Acidoferrales bacterium]
MTLKQIFVAPDGRLRPGLRALLFLPTYAALLAVLIFLLRSFLPRPGEQDNELFLLGQSLVLVPMTALASWILLRLADRCSFRNLGLWFYAGWGRELGLGLGVGALMLSVVVGAGGAFGGTEWHLRDVEPMVLLRGFLWAAALLIPAATFEELLFRGYPFQRLVESWGAPISVVAISGLFGLGHASNPNATWFTVANTILAGIWLAQAYLKTRGLWYPIGLHFSWNFIMAYVYSLPVSGIVLSSQLLTAKDHGPQWLTGGDYGPEGSILCTGVLVVAIVWQARTGFLKVAPAMAAELEAPSATPSGEVEWKPAAPSS